MSKVVVVAGAQFGSEAKGHVTDRLVKRAIDGRRKVVNVRVGGPNAGHTVYGLGGTKFAFRQLPVGSLLEGVTPVIAAGSEIDIDVLMDELTQRSNYAQAMSLDLQPVLIDPEATVIEWRHKEAEDGLTRRLGSTAKGIGAARADRLMRKAGRIGFDYHNGPIEEQNAEVVDTFAVVNSDGTDVDVVIEGTQGYGLGLHAGFYPFCTSGDCTTLDFLAQARVLPYNTSVDPWIVARTFPIRVAGNSGPLHGETTWEELGLPEERTTVTKKVRRVGTWDDELFGKAVAANGGAGIIYTAITMLDQLFPEVAGVTERNSLTSDARKWLDGVATRHGVVIDLVTTGPQTAVWMT